MLAPTIARQGPGTPARQLRRVTVVVDDPGEAQFLSGALRGLRNAGAELVAARPTSERVLSFLCESADVDLISLDVRGGRMGFALTAKQVK
jgi:RNase P/RNase MRP subunit p30